MKCWKICQNVNIDAGKNCQILNVGEEKDQNKKLFWHKIKKNFIVAQIWHVDLRRGKENFLILMLKICQNFKIEVKICQNFDFD